MNEQKNKSTDLSKIGRVYERYVRGCYDPNVSASQHERVKRVKSRVSRRISSKNNTEKKPVEKKLNKYQKFVAKESVKKKYKGYNPKDRLRAIASEWKKLNAEKERKKQERKEKREKIKLSKKKEEKPIKTAKKASQKIIRKSPSKIKAMKIKSPRKNENRKKIRKSR